MFDVSPNQAEEEIKEAIKQIDGAKLISMEKRENPSSVFSNSSSIKSYTKLIRNKLTDEGKIVPVIEDNNLNGDIPF